MNLTQISNPILVIIGLFFIGMNGLGFCASESIPHDMNHQIFLEINQLRTNPQEFISILQKRLAYYDGNVLRQPQKNGSITVEGKAACEEAIQFLRKIEPLSDLVYSESLAHAACDHGRYLAQSGHSGHEGDSGSRVWDRVARYGVWQGKISELLGFGKQTPREYILEWIIDDGINNRAHRELLFHPNLRLIGVCVDTHPTLERTCILVLAHQFEEHDRAKK